LFENGLPLIGRVGRDLAVDIDLFSRGGMGILRAIERQGYDVLSARPALSTPRRAYSSETSSIVTECPARALWAAIPLPMIPAPTTKTRSGLPVPAERSEVTSAPRGPR